MKHHHLLTGHRYAGAFKSTVFTVFIIAATQVFSQGPLITVRFANPQFDQITEMYCADVEFKSNIPDQQIFGMNVRFFYDDSVLEFVQFTGFEGGYNEVLPSPPGVFTSPNGPALFNFTGGAEFVNGAIQLIDDNASPVILQTDSWTKVFQICFEIDDPNADQQNFCPSLIWDLEVNPANGSFLPGSDGVVITVVDPGPFDSQPSTENAEQFNWTYSGPGTAPYGHSQETACIPLSSWLAINCVADVNISCESSTDPAHTGSATAADNCDGDILMTYNDAIIHDDCENNYTIIRTWNASNDCNASASCMQMIYVSDTKAPVINGVPAITCIDDPALQQITATDNCGNASLSYSESTVPHPQGRGKAIRRIYKSIDDCGNMSMDTVILLKKNECNRAANPNDGIARTEAVEENAFNLNYRSEGVASTFAAWPNPVSDLLNVSYESAEANSCIISLVNMQGIIVKKTITPSVKGKNTLTLDVSGFTPGTYLMQIRNDDQVSTQMIMITDQQ